MTTPKLAPWAASLGAGAILTIGIVMGAAIRPAGAGQVSPVNPGGLQVVPFLPQGQAAGGTVVPPQPIEIQSLDKEHFVVATREPRLVRRIGSDAAAQQMLVTVVVHYTIDGARLLPIEHVRVPTGYRAVEISD